MKSDWNDARAAAKHWAVAFGVAGAVAVIVAFGLTLAANADGMATGSGVVCDTADQVKAVILNKHINVREAVAEVNAAAKGEEEVCALMTIAFVRGAKLAEVPVSAGIYEVIEVTVLGAFDAGAWRITKPVKQVTAIFHKAQAI